MVIAGWLPHTCAPSCCLFRQHLFHLIRNVAHKERGLTIGLYERLWLLFAPKSLWSCVVELKGSDNSYIYICAIYFKFCNLMTPLFLSLHYDCDGAASVVVCGVDGKQLEVRAAAGSSQRLTKNKRHHWPKVAGEWTLFSSVFTHIAKKKCFFFLFFPQHAVVRL